MKMDDYYTQLQETVLNHFRKCNNTDKIEKKTWTIPAGSWEVHVVRGDMLEKGTVSRISLKTKNPVDNIDTSFNILQINLFPLSPMVPIGLFNMENRVGKADSFNGYADTASIVENKEDQEFLRKEIKQMIEHYGGDYTTLKQKVENIYKMDSWEKPLNDGAGMRLELKKEQSALLKEAGVKWVECYFKIAERRSKDTYDDSKLALMNAVRARLMAFYLLKDQSFKVAHKIGTPLETLTLMAFPPVVTF